MRREKGEGRREKGEVTINRKTACTIRFLHKISLDDYGKSPFYNSYFLLSPFSLLYYPGIFTHIKDPTIDDFYQKELNFTNL